MHYPCGKMCRWFCSFAFSAYAGILSLSFSFFNYNIDIFVSIGQYKHRYVLAYFCWRILLGLQIAGHARYLHFGQLLYFFKIAKISTCLGEIYSQLFRMTL